MAGWWLASRMAVMALVAGIASTGTYGPERHPLRDGHWLLDRFAQWDSYHLVRIAEQGYFGPGRDCCDQAWFPAYPLLLRILRPVFLGSTIGAGIALSLAASTVAAVVLWRLALLTSGRRDVAAWAVVLLGTAPYAVFLVSVYTEALWLAAALLAWWYGLRGRWWAAGGFAALATATRVNGLFLTLGLAVMYALQLHAQGRRAPRRDGLALALPVLAALGYAGWLHTRTGGWLAWHDAERRGWGRTFSWPWQALDGQLRAIWQAPGYLVPSRVVDLLAIGAGLLLVVALARRRAWPELAFVVPSVAVVLTQPTFIGAGRYALTWFPAYLLLASAAARPRTRWVPVAAALAALLVGALIDVLFGLRIWVG